MVNDITARNRTDDALRDANQFNIEIVSQAGEGIIVYDRDLRYVVWNRFMERMTGAKAKDVIGRNALDIFPHLHEQGVDQLLKRALNGETVTSSDTPFHSPFTNQRGWVVGTYAPHRNALGEIIGVIATVKDITEHKRAEEAQRTSESFLNSIIDQSPLPMLISDDRGKLIRINQACRNLLHISDEEVVGKYNILEDNIIEEQGFMPQVRGVFEAGETARFEIKYDSSQLKHIHITHFASVIIAVTVFPIRDSRGKITNAVIQHIDITERKLAEEALRESEERYRTVVSSASDGIMLQESTGRILTWNTTVEKVFGVKAAEVLDHTSNLRSWRTIREDGSEFPGAEHPSVHTLMTGEPCKNVVMGVRNATTDQLSWINISTNPLFRGGEPKPYAVVISFSDITERKRAEEALQESERKFRETVTHLDEGYYSVTLDGLLLDHNLAFNRILGIDISKDMEGSKLPDFWQNPDERNEYLNELMSRGFIRNYLINAKTISDEKIVVLANSHLVKDEKGRVLRVDGTFTDFTERKLAIKEIESLAKFPDENPNPVLRITADCTIIYANSGSASFLEPWGGQVGLRLPDDYRNLVLESFGHGNQKEIENKSKTNYKKFYICCN
jgi:PAS domain S-box-containing protein